MIDFRLQVFYTAAKNLSFTKAAQELYISQPSITRHINKLEDEFQVLLFERVGNKLKLTTAGERLLVHCERLMQDYHALDYEMHLLKNEHVGALRIGASTTIAQYVLPPILARFLEQFHQAHLSMINGNSRTIEEALNSHDIDLGLIEGITRMPLLTYTKFQDDELLIVTAANTKYAKQGTLSLEEFKQAPLVLRERGSGTLETIEHQLLAQQLKSSELNVAIYLGSSEAIKLFLQNSETISVLSRAAVRKELEQGLLKVITTKPQLSFTRTFCFVQAPGPKQPLVERFMDFALEESQR